MPQNKETAEKTAKKTGNAGYVANITLRLLVICALVALLVAGVNAITKDKIELNGRENTAKALTAIYESDGLRFAMICRPLLPGAALRSAPVLPPRREAGGLPSRGMETCASGAFVW